MANTIEITKINQGNRNALFHVYLASDGSSGELVDEVLIDPVADLGLLSSHRLAIESIHHSLSGFSARIEFDTGLVDDKMIWVLNETTDLSDFKYFGGLKDRSGVDGTGKIQLTTDGFSATGDQGSLVIAVRQ